MAVYAGQESLSGRRGRSLMSRPFWTHNNVAHECAVWSIRHAFVSVVVLDLGNLPGPPLPPFALCALPSCPRSHHVARRHRDRRLPQTLDAFSDGRAYVTLTSVVSVDRSFVGTNQIKMYTKWNFLPRCAQNHMINRNLFRIRLRTFSR